MKGKLIRGAVVACLAGAVPGFAAHPLFTDDVYTQGKGNWQFEQGIEEVRDKENGVETRSTEYTPVLAYGITDALDLQFAVPLIWAREDTAGVTTRASGKGDVVLELKWRFYDTDALKLGVKPGISFDTGDDTKGLGTGKTNGSVATFATMERGDLTWLAQVSYSGNRNLAGERSGLWALSGGVLFQAAEKLKLVADLGVETNPDPARSQKPAVLLGGFIYSPNKDLDLDLAVKGGLNNAADDWSVLGGVTVRW